jgi:ABC-type Co2+ transport system permease subunit
MYGQQQPSGISFDASEILVRFLKYIFEGLMVAIAAYFIPNTKLPPKELLMIALVAAATFAVLDLFAPSVGSSVRNGAGFGIGANLVGFPGGGMAR